MMALKLTTQCAASMALAAGIALGAGDVSLRLNGLEIALNGETGGIVWLAYPPAGEFLAAGTKDAGLLDVAYPVESFGPMRLATRFSRAQITRTGEGAVIVWDPLGPSRRGVALPSGHVTARVTLRAAEDGRSVVLTCRIENRSAAPVPQVMFPDLEGLEPVDGLEHTRIRFAAGTVEPFAGPVKPKDAAPFYIDRGWKHYPASGYYGMNALRWLDFGGPRGGLSVFQKKWGTDDEPDVRTARTEAAPSRLRLLWEHRARIAPGASWESGEFWLTPHRGGWAKGVEVYREWVRRGNPQRELPRHIRDGLGFQSIWMMQELESDAARAAFRFADLPRVAEDAKAHGLTEIVPWGWCRYFRIPIPLRTELGSQEDLLEGIRRARAMGVNVAPFVSIHNLMPEGAQRYGGKAGSGNWTYHPELIPNFRPFYDNELTGTWIDSGNLEWQHAVAAELERWVNLGLASMSWDQFSNRDDANRTTGMVALVEKVRAAARARDPQSTFSGESIRPGSMEADGAVLDYTWNWVDYVDAGPLVNLLRAPRLNCNVEDSPLVVRKCFAENLFLNVMPRRPDQPNGTALVSEQPALAAALREAAALRRQFLPYFTEGTALGDSVVEDGTAGFVRGYQMGNRLLILTLNDRAEARAIGFRTDLSLWLPAGAGYTVRTYDAAGRLTGERPAAGAEQVLVTPALAPAQLAVFEVQAP
ncbi:MAG TPA: hypothetical protein VFA33_08315 [Bryobacteraceae bacterium]|nr:hypothetical protein [Bryobacteraceae bacterium]